MSDYLHQHTINTSFGENSITSFVILSDIEKRIKEKIEQNGIPLKDWDINIYRGILTGYNEAFIIDGKTKDELIEKSPKNAEIIRPILRGRDIKRYGYEFADLWLIYIPWHFPLHKDSSIVGASEKAELEFRKEYPDIYDHLLKYKEQLSNRNKAETGIRYEWYALQRWGANYMDDFFKQKIIFQEMVQEPSFMYDIEGKFYCLDTGRIITGRDIDYLITILNSKLFFFAIKYFYGGGGLGANGVRMKHTFFDKFCCPILSTDQKQAFVNLLNMALKSNNMEETIKINKIIDEKIFSLYGLNINEIKFIESLQNQ